jgi:hypothetical protein
VVNYLLSRGHTVTAAVSVVRNICSPDGCSVLYIMNVNEMPGRIRMTCHSGLTRN